MKSLVRVMALSLATLTAACGKDDPIGPNVVNCGLFGSFNGSATGASAATLSGCSWYAITEDNEDETGPFFGLVLTNGSDLETNSHTVNIARAGARPAVGTYNVGLETGQFSGGVFLDDDRIFFLTSGTVTITASSSDNVVGSLNVTATEFEGNATISVTGNFTAKCLQGSSSSVTFSC